MNRRLVEQIAVPLVVVLVAVLPALMSAMGTWLVLAGNWRGLTTLIVPAYVAWWAWDSRGESYLHDGLVKWMAMSWLSGVPLGAALWFVGDLTSSPA